MTLHRFLVFLGLTVPFVIPAVVLSQPTADPLAVYDVKWSSDVAWTNVLSIDEVRGATLHEKLENAQRKLREQGGGVVYFPAGEYQFHESIHLADGIVLRGADAPEVTDARADGYAPPTRFIFPKYSPKLSGDGTPIETAFKGVYLKDPVKASKCGLINLDLNYAHVKFGAGPDYESGTDRFIVGCVVRSAAIASDDVPDLSIGQKPWQRYTERHSPAISVITKENALIANNRLPDSSADNFLMPDYALRRGGETVEIGDGVWFDYNNRPGIYVNSFSLGGSGGNPLPDGTPETHPHGFRKGIQIRNNYIASTGRTAISFSGDGTICSDNVIRFQPEVVRPTHTGTRLASGSSTNDNRAIQMRGWRWVVERNDFEVYRNRVWRSDYYINDGEGMMHEDHVNSTVKDSRLVGNTGNAYISIYNTGGIDGLLVQDNTIKPSESASRIHSIYVVADRNPGGKNPSRHECRNVRILDNVTSGTGIRIAGAPASMNVVSGNRHTGAGTGVIVNQAGAQLQGNEGYTVQGENSR